MMIRVGQDDVYYTKSKSDKTNELPDLILYYKHRTPLATHDIPRFFILSPRTVVFHI